MSDKKQRKEVEKKSLLKKIMTFGARDKAAKAKREKYLSPKKKWEFKRKFKGEI